MGHYKSNLRDLQFNLFELFELEKVLGEGEYADLDRDTVNDMLREVKALSESPLAEPFANTDRNPPVFDPETHSVSIPRASRRPWRPSRKADGSSPASVRRSAASPSPQH